MTTKIFDLRALDMSSAYDWSQCEAIAHGDVMLVADGVAVMCEAWPTMVAGASDVFHRVADGVTWEQIALRPDMAAALLAGVAVARRPLAELVADALTYDQLADLAELADLATIRADLAAERDRRLAELDYPEHELEAIRAALAATRCAA